jgi:tRNA(adenine34) deaminase
LRQPKRISQALRYVRTFDFFWLGFRIETELIATTIDAGGRIAHNEKYGANLKNEFDGGDFMYRRTLLKGGVILAASTFALSSEAGARSSPSRPEDEAFMKMALEEAAEAAFPFGAVIVKDREVLARGHNRTGADRDPTAHGEMVAIRSFLAARGPDALKGATLYTSGEPCCMCMGAIIWCGISRLVFAASLAQLMTKLDQIAISAEDVANKAVFAPIDITGGVLAEDAMRLFK